MEKQSTSKFLRSVIAVVALFMLAVSGFLLTSCKHVHSEPNDFGACTDCGSIIDWDKFGSQMSTLLDPSFDDLTASLTDLASEVTEVKGDVDSIIGALNVADDGSDIDTIVKNVQAVLDQIENLIGANPSVAAKATAPTITGIANAVTSVQETLNKIGAGNIEHVCENHQFDTETPVIEIEPTCERAGAVVYRCSKCNATIALPVNQLEHVAADEPVKENVVAPTCTTDGSYDLVYYCKNGCGEPLSTEHVVDPQKGHDWDKENPVTTQPATCTEAGSAVYTCKVCGAQSEEFVLPATGHSYDWTTPVSEVAPKCEVEGSATYKCANCENTITLKPSDEEKPESMTDEQWTAFVAAYKATGHNYTNDDGTENFVWKYGDEIDFSVNEITATKYLVCTVCGHEEVAKGTDGKPVTEQQVHIWKVDTEKTEAQTNIKKLAETDAGYDKSHFGYVNTSCQASAYVYWICEDSNCKLHADEFGFPIEVELKPVEHVWVANPEKPNILPTCETEGHNYWICSVGGEEWDEVIAANGHSWDKDTLIEEVLPTCTEDGFRTYKCTVCGETQTDTLPALDHDPVVTTTYEKIDSNTHKITTVTTCERCNVELDRVEKTESHYEGESMLNPTTKEEAEEIAEKYGLEIYEKDNKFYFTDAGCDRSGFIMNVCACGHIERDWNSYVPALKHDWSEGVYIEGSCVTAGKIQYTCERCGEIYIETVQNATGHDWKVVEAVAPGCTTNGNKAYAYCDTCGVVYEITDGETPNKWSTDYVEGLNYKTDKAAVEAWANIVPTGHTFDEESYILIAAADATSCTDPAWKIYVCSECGDVDLDANTFTLVADDEAYEGKPATVTLGEADDAFITLLVTEFNKLGTELTLTEEMLKSGTIEGFNIMGIEYVAETGHTLTDKTSSVTDDTWGYSENATIVCKNDANLDSYADALAFAKFVNSELEEEAFKAAFDAIFGTDDSNRNTYAIKTDGTKPALAGVCKDCGMPIATADHDEHYYMFMITNGEEGEAYAYNGKIDVDTAYVHTDTYLVKDKDGNTAYKTQTEIDASEGAWTKVVFTYEEVVGLKYTNPNGSVNCYFEGFCVRDCGIDMGHKAQHTFPTSDNYDKYHNCKHGDICVWCSNVLALSDDHNLQDLEEIAASDNKEYADAAAALYKAAETAREDYPWVGKDTENATCKDPAEDWTITVCVSCLLDWYKDGASDPDVWTLFDANDPESEGNYTSVRVETTGKHNYVEKSVGDRENPSCLVGFAAWYECTICGEKLTYVEQTAADAPDYIKELKPLNEDDYIAEGYSKAKPHNVAPVFNYYANNDYIPATDTTPAYMNFICVECGERLQGFYDDGVAEDGSIRYTMATDKQISDYNAKFDKPQVQVVRPEDKAAVTTVEFAAGATDADKVAAVAKAIADAEKEDATSVYLTIPGDFTIGASDTTTGENTVWQAYGITFSADSSVKKIVFDLGGNKLTFGQADSYNVKGEGTVVFSNGLIDANKAEQGKFFLMGYQSSIVFDHVTVETSGVIGFGNNEEPKTALGSVVITESTIKSTGYFGFSTNASDWQNSKVEVTIVKSTISAGTEDGDNCAVMMNVPGTFTVKDSTIEADRQGIILRGGKINASIENTTINLSGKYESKDKYLTEAWGSGNEVPMGGIVLGDNNNAYMTGLMTVALNNVTVNVSAEDVAKVYVYATAEDVQVDLTITNADAAAAPTLAADDITANVTEANDGVYKLTVDGKVEINNVL